mmetsp:Transcript_9156/g.20392  ORF Transcript_9156/g.20392 Transcript_9156/m.20392 type:complete len:547 (-) Transcript_9156:40-1680(-)
MPYVTGHQPRPQTFVSVADGCIEANGYAGSDVSEGSLDDNSPGGERFGFPTSYELEKRFVDLFPREESPPLTTQQLGNLGMGAVICINAVLMAVELDYGPEPGAPLLDRLGFFLCEVGFALVYTIELFVRVFYEGSAWPWSAWNWLDVVVLLFASVDIWLVVHAETSVSGLQHLSFLKLLRLVRLTRLLKLLRVFRGLYAIVMAFMRSLVDTFWIACLICLGLFLSALLATSIVGKSEEFSNLDLDGESGRDRFGTVPRSMYSLFELMTLEGWDKVARPLVMRQPLLFVLFATFILIFSFGLLNMVVGIVVAKTLHMSKCMQEDEQREAHCQLVQDLLQLCRAIETNPHHTEGMVSYEEFRSVLESNSRLRRSCFPSAGDDFSEADDFFAILDADNTGLIPMEELMEGLLKLRGAMPVEWDLLNTHAVVQNLSQRFQGSSVNKLPLPFERGPDLAGGEFDDRATDRATGDHKRNGVEDAAQTLQEQVRQKMHEVIKSLDANSQGQADILRRLATLEERVHELQSTGGQRDEHRGTSDARDHAAEGS